MENINFDYVIVGGGTAGLVLASRLSHSFPEASILVLEAGPASDPRIIPAMGVLSSDSSDIQWNHETVPQKSLGGKIVPQVQGRILGGSAAINYMTWTRGASAEFDQWAKEVGDERWCWNGLLPYFNRSENFKPGKNMTQSPQNEHGYDGPITVAHISSSGKTRNYPLKSMVEDIYSEAGVPRISDANTGKTIGFADMASCTINGERQYGPACYPRGSNVTVWTDTTAARLVIDGTRVTGVELSGEGNGVRKVSANKEVIVASGVQGSAKLLLLSGIGPSAELAQHGIKQVVDLPVGENFTDHPFLTTHWKLKERNLSLGDMEMVTPDCDWTAGCPCDFLGFHRHSTPEIYSLVKSLSDKDLQRVNISERPQTETFVMYIHMDPTQTADPHPGGSVFTMANIVVTPTSRGSIKLSSSNPAEPILIDPAFFTSELDKALIFECARMTYQAIASSRIATKYGAEEFNISEELRGRTDDEAMYQRLLRTSQTVNHGSGTCAMGSVVDTECRVKGVQGLRVVDASVLPFPIGAHYQAIVYAVAEQIADIIVRER